MIVNYYVSYNKESCQQRQSQSKTSIMNIYTILAIFFLILRIIVQGGQYITGLFVSLIYIKWFKYVHFYHSNPSYLWKIISPLGSHTNLSPLNYFGHQYREYLDRLPQYCSSAALQCLFSFLMWTIFFRNLLRKKSRAVKSGNPMTSLKRHNLSPEKLRFYYFLISMTIGFFLLEPHVLNWRILGVSATLKLRELAAPSSEK